MDLVVTHTSTDFDALGALLAARRLYPGSLAVLPGALNGNVRAFVLVHERELGLADPRTIDAGAVTRVVVVEATHRDRIEQFSQLLGRADVEVVLFDHHGDVLPPWAHAEASVVSADGALSTTMVHVLAERGVEPSALEATALALGIHEDTGSLTHPSTTPRDVEALAWCVRRGASLQALGRYLHQPLSEEQLHLFDQLVASLAVVAPRGVEVAVAAAVSDSFVDGVSELAHPLASLTGQAALVCLVELRGRTECVIRSDGAELDAGALARALGGGGHRRAAAALVPEPLATVRAAVLSALPGAVTPASTAAELMTATGTIADPATTVAEALRTIERAELDGLHVGSRERLVGSIARADLERAVGHALSRAPLHAVMGPPPERVAADAPAAAVARAIAREPSGIVAVERDGVVVGGVTRAALRRALGEPEASGPAPREAGLDLAEALRALPGLMTVFGAIEVVAKVVPGVYLVGGAVRDLLLGARSIDVDVAVEGDAVAFARALARALHGRATVHERFATASIRHPGGRIDVTTARTELYDAPGALPAVRRATIEDDLHRRDFTINAMAVSLRTADFGRLVDPFGGRRDLERGLVRVLHGLSFVDDPTRLFRAARYASRLRFRVEGHTLGLARACVRMGLVGRLSGHRVADELALLLGERDGLEGVGLLDELGVLAALHPGITGDAETRSLACRIDDLRAEHTPELPVWRPRLAVLCRHLAPDDLSAWLSSIELRRRDAARIADACAAARVLPDALGAARTPAEAFRVASAHDPDGVLLALATCPPGRAHDWLVRYLRELRHVRPAITGADLAALGLPESPRVGDVLRELHHRKLNGELATRDDELDAARTLVAELLRDGP